METKLKRSKDRKVTNALTPKLAPAIANSFGLPAGKDFTCPDATATCETVCYAGKLEVLYRGVREVLTHNHNLLKDEDRAGMASLLEDMVSDFVADCEKRDAPKVFRIHWDGDFFNRTYTEAWRDVVETFKDVQFWVYTRVAESARMLKDIGNLSLYYSADKDNFETAEELRREGIRLAYLADTFQEGQARMKEITGKPGAKCPENTRQLKLVQEKGSACVACGLCIYNKADIVFSATKK